MTTSRKIAIAALLVAIGVLVWDKTRPDGSITQPASAQAHNATTSKPATAPPRLAQQTTPTPSLRPIGPPLMTASSPASKKSTLTPGYPPHQTHPNPCANKTWPPNLPLTLSPPALKPLSTPSVHHKINRSITCPATSSPPLPPFSPPSRKKSPSAKAPNSRICLPPCPSSPASLLARTTDAPSSTDAWSSSEKLSDPGSSSTYNPIKSNCSVAPLVHPSSLNRNTTVNGPKVRPASTDGNYHVLCKVHMNLCRNL